MLIFTWERDYWLDCSLPLWTLPFLYHVACVSSLPLLFSTQSLCVPDDGEHLGNWLLAGYVSLLLTPPFYPSGHLCLLPPSSLLCITPWTSLSGPNCGVHIRKWLLASLLSSLLIPPHLIRVTSNSFFPLSSPCNSVNLSGCPSLWRNFSSLTEMFYKRCCIEGEVLRLL